MRQKNNKITAPIHCGFIFCSKRMMKPTAVLNTGA